MQTTLNDTKVLLFWDKTTWYSLGALTASLQRYNIPYEIIKEDVTKHIQNSIDQGFNLIYGESTLITTVRPLEKRLKAIQKKNYSPKLITVVGGPQASGDPQKFLSMGIDYVIVGEGEVTFPELIRTLAFNEFKHSFVRSLPGIAFIDESGKMIQTQKPDHICLDKNNPYSDSKDFPIHPPIELMRGCPFRCRFCQVPYLYGNPRFRSIDTITKIVEHYIQHFQPLKKNVDIRFIAPNSLGYLEKKRGVPNYDALDELMTRLNQYDIRIFFGTFPSEIRPEYITDEVLTLFEKLTNRRISVGFQSGSDRVLSKMRRGHSVADGLNALDLLTSHGLTPFFDFLLGTPSETLSEQWETLDLIREIGRKAQVRLHYFIPLPGTPWKNTIPSPLESEIQSAIGRLTQSGIVTGVFAKQFQISCNYK